MKISTPGLDMAKSVFHMVWFDAKHWGVGKRTLRRYQVLAYFAQRELCWVAMEARVPGRAWRRRVR